MSLPAADGKVSLATWLGFGMMCLAMFMAILDVQVVATSLGVIKSALKIGQDQISWIQTAYLTAEVIAIPLTGLLQRTLSMRWLVVGAVATFTAASVGCAASDSFAVLIGWRIVQGFAAGAIIPTVFSAVFLLIPERRQALATTLAGVTAVLAPIVGPIVGGWITQTYSWHWLFLINVTPGVIAAASCAWLLPREGTRMGALRGLDVVSLLAMAAGLAALEIGLKEAPDRGWLSPVAGGLLGLALACAALFMFRTVRAARPIVMLKTFRDPAFSVACLLSFVLGMGLFGSVYLMPAFLAFARGHGALEIGRIMLVTGAAQLVAAPIAVALERRIAPRLLSAIGFAVFGVGLLMSINQTPDTDFAEMIWPQIVRGAAVMFCVLPPTRLALGGLAAEAVPDASALFNLMRNLGGAIGLALVDTVIYGRSPALANHIVDRLKAGDTATAHAVGIPLALFDPHQPVTPAIQALLRPMVERLAFVQAVNEAWLMVGVLTLLVLLAIPFAGARRSVAS
ncbi:MDR family MFS transporter [soil metagenome]